MVITLSASHSVTIQPAIIKTISTLTVNRLVDVPKQKMVKCFVDELNEPIILWQGTDYDKIGQWTDADVENRLNALYNAS